MSPRRSKVARATRASGRLPISVATARRWGAGATPSPAGFSNVEQDTGDQEWCCYAIDTIENCLAALSTKGFAFNALTNPIPECGCWIPRLRAIPARPV